MSDCITRHVGLDVHQDSIEIATAEVAGGEVRHVGRIGGDLPALDAALTRLRCPGSGMQVVYEAGPCGYAIYRHLVAQRIACAVVAPSLTPRRPGERIKTDRRDALKLARLSRAGELRWIRVPDAEDEALRDLLRAREDTIRAQRDARHRLKALLLRQDIRYTGKTAWTPAHERWLASVRLPTPAQQVVFQEYVDSVHQATLRIARLDSAIGELLPVWSRYRLVQELQALRGVRQLHAAVLVAEVGPFERFESPRQLMGFLGLTPSESSSGTKRRQGAITKTGNGFARRALVEAAWQYRFPARVGPTIAQRQCDCSETSRAIAWKAQLRLCARFRRLRARRMLPTKVVVAIARELSGFVWAIACKEAAAH
ncbi:MAG: IS110 family transposase [Candidatus Dormibacteria bacterium]